MRKLFLLIPAMLLTLAVNAKETAVTPGTNAIQTAVTAADPNDVLVLSTGTYTENSSFSINKSITIQAATGAKPVIENAYYFKIEKGADVTFRGIKFDGKDACEHLLRSHDASTGEEDIVFENCEFTRYAKYLLYTQRDSRRWNSITIRNCYFHNNPRSAVYIDDESGGHTKQSCNSVTIENTTFADFTDTYPVINFKAPEAEHTGSLNMNHCTFYNLSYNAVKWASSANLNITNCIFAQPIYLNRYSVECEASSTIEYCLALNTKGYNITSTHDVAGNPYFVNLEPDQYDFSVASFSPAYAAGSDEKNLGDIYHWTSDDSAHPTTKNLAASTDVLKPAVEMAWPGDTISLETGEYEQGENYTIYDKNLVVKAATSATPVVKFSIPTKLQGGHRLEFDGIKFDMTNLNSKDYYEHFISVEDASNGNKLIFKNCELCNYPINSSAIYCSSSNKLDSLIVDNCKFYDMKKSCIWLNNAGLIGASITNSTFYNISTVTDSYYAAVTDIRTTAGKVIVDHCTFYDCMAMSTSYGAVYVPTTPNVTISNNIFSMSTSTDNQRAVWLPDGEREVKNCLVYNYTSDSGKGIRSSNTKTNCIFKKNPLFKDAENGDFTLYPASSARGKATDVPADLGDPRWACSGTPTITIPATLEPLDAVMSDSAGVIVGSPNVIDFKEIGSHQYNSTEWAKWSIKVTKAGYYSFTLNAQSTNSQTYKISVLGSDESEIQTYSLTGEYNKSMTKTTDALELAVGDYFIKVENTVEWSTGDVISIVANYAGGAATEIPGLLKAEDAVLEAKKMYHDENGYIHYGSYGTIPTDEYAYWRITTTDAYSGKVILDIPAESNGSGHEFHVELYTDLNGSKLSEAYETAVSYADNRLIELEQTFEISEAGTYYVRLVNATQWSSAVLRSISIAPNLASTIDEEETDVEAVIGANDGKTVNVQLTRSLVAGMYNTICLPFAVSAAEMGRVFPGAVVKELSSSSLEEGGYILNLNFSAVSEMAAGKPYLIKPAANVVNPKFIGVTIDKTLRPINTSNANFIGNFIAGTIEADPTNLFLGAENTLYFPTQEIEILGMRAYFKVHDAPGAPAGMIKRARIVENEQILTDIELVKSQEPIVNSQKLIENGQLIIVRDGVRYNALGIKLQ